MSEKIKAYKAMNKDMTCRGKQYEVGKTYVEDEADCCNSGMHACTDPFDVLHYYQLGSSILFEVECGGKVSKGNDDSKIACTEMTVNGEMNLFDFVKLGIKAVFEKVKDSPAATSGDYSTAATSGYYSTAATSGDYSTAATSGDCSTAATSGDCSTAATSGYRSTAATSGDCSTAATSGDYSTAATSGKYSIAVANGYKSKASGSIGNYLVLTEYDDVRNLICAKMEQVDGERIKENTLYMLKNGEFVEVE